MALTVLQKGDIESVFYDMKIKIWDSIDGSLKRILTCHPRNIRAVAFHGVLVSRVFQEIKILNINDGTVKLTIIGHTYWVYALKKL